ncbi:acyl-CoA dehydrogenase family protein [Paraburkholderia phymatum]|uniref:Acyl-CoA dehydrogenase family protein n=1 Tax=Paraburkholderia phymatum TaxID=148447 RepID=A0ACC6U3Q1_9BURK
MESLFGNYRSPWMTEELDMLRTTARRFFEKEVTPHQEKWRKQHYIDKSVWLKAGELGLIGVSYPEEHGGHGGNYAHDVVIMEEQARACDTAWGYVPGVIGAPTTLILTGTPKQIDKWLPPIIRGEKLLAFAATEPDCGTDIKTLRTTARREGDEYVLNGSKMFITHGSRSDLAIVAARTNGPGAKGISLFMVEKDKVSGFKVNKILEKMGQHGLDTCEIFLDDVRVPAENLLGGVEGNGFGKMMDSFVKERLTIAVTAIASTERAIELTLDHVKQRKMFNQTLWDFQNTKFKLAECVSQVRIGRVFIDSLIQRLVEGVNPPSAEEAAMAKVWCSEVQWKVIDECVQLFGGYGYMAEYPICQFMMDARIQRLYGGSNEILKELIARKL